MGKLQKKNILFAPEAAVKHKALAGQKRLASQPSAHPPKTFGDLWFIELHCRSNASQQPSTFTVIRFQG